MKHFLSALALCLALILLSGCTQQSSALSACSGAAPGHLVNCIYVNAVYEQNPYYCYDIPADKAEARLACLTDASDYAMKRILERMLPAERDALFVDAAVAGQPVPTQPSAALNGTAAGGIPVETPAQNLSENETYTGAIAGLDILRCEGIDDSSLRNSCISQIATKTKNMSVCASLSEAADQDLCYAYAQG